MIYFIQGELTEVNKDYIIIKNNGIGFIVYIPNSAHNNLPLIGEYIFLYTYFHVKENEMLLYGFLKKDELSAFKQLITVNGIGPKGALSILSHMTINDLKLALITNDAESIAKIPGIGFKTAGKLILELKYKFKIEDAIDNDDTDKNTIYESNNKSNSTLKEEAIKALMALGFSSSEAIKSVKDIPVTKVTTVQDIIKASLKRL